MIATASKLKSAYIKLNRTQHVIQDCAKQLFSIKSSVNVQK